MIDSRPLSQAERRDIVSHTDHLLGRLRARSIDHINGVQVFATKACVQLVYVGFGFKIMREQFPEEGSWKAFLKKFYPREGHATVELYIAIGRHFHYDETYLTFLSGCNYAVPPAEIDQKRNIGSQLEELRKGGAKVASPSDLLKLAREYLPEIENRKKALFSSAGLQKWRESNLEEADAVVVRGSGQDQGQEWPENSSNGDHDQTQESAESSKVLEIDEKAFVAARLVQRLLKSLSELSNAKVYFEKLADTAPVTDWDKETVTQLKKALRPAKQMIDHLFEAA